MLGLFHSLSLSLSMSLSLSAKELFYFGHFFGTLSLGQFYFEPLLFWTLLLGTLLLGTLFIWGTFISCSYLYVVGSTIALWQVGEKDCLPDFPFFLVNSSPTMGSSNVFLSLQPLHFTISSYSYSYRCIHFNIVFRNIFSVD